MKLEYNVKKNNVLTKISLKVIDEIEIKESSQNVEFSSITVDFTKYTKEDLPYSFQEVQLIDNNEILYTGYIDDYELPDITNFIEKIKIKVNLLSPMSMSTKRYLTLNITDSFETILKMLFNPLISDGFTLNLDIESKIINVKYFSQSIYDIANDLSKKYDLYWHIDKNKKILVTNVEKLFSDSIKLNIESKKDLKGISSIVPKMYSFDYFNVIKLVNGRIIQIDDLYNPITGEIYQTKDIVIKKDSDITFKYPFVLELETLKNLYKQYGKEISCLSIGDKNNRYQINIVYNGNLVFDFYNNGWQRNRQIIYDDDENASNFELVLKRDSFFKNLITGIKWQGETFTSEAVYTRTMLKYQINTMYNIDEINKYKNIISPSGIIEKVIDLKEGWYTKKDLYNYCKNLIIENQKEINTISLDINNKDYNLSIGDRIRISLNKYFLDDVFVINNITTIYKNNFSKYKINAINSNINNDYLDLFRSDKTIEDEEKYNDEDILQYNEEKIIERVGIEEYEDI